MGAKGGRNLRGIEGNPDEEGLYQRLNITMPPSILSRLDSFWVDEWLKKRGY